MKQLISIIMVILLVIVQVSCAKKEVAFKDSCWKQVTNCETTDLDDGTVSVKLTAPDYIAIVQYLAENNITEKVTVEMLTKAAEDNPDAVKEYSFIAESAKKEAIKNALMEKIAYELVIVTMEYSMG